MKKAIVFALILALACFVFVGCDKPDKDSHTINVVMPDGAPALALAKLFYENPKFDGYKINYNIVAGATGIQEKMLSGEADIALLPTNMAANLYNKGIDIKIVACNVFGLLYMVGKTPIDQLEDLYGKTVYNLGQGNTPDFVFKTILEQNDINYAATDTPKNNEVGLRYAPDAESIIAMMKASQIEYAILGEPQVSQALNIAEDFEIVLNLQQEWQQGYPQVATVAKADIIEIHKDFLNSFLQEVEQNVQWIADNPEKVGQALASKGSQVNFISAESIARCNIRFEKAGDIQETIDNYLRLMYDFNVNFVGGKIPDEGLYYKE